MRSLQELMDEVYDRHGQNKFINVSKKVGSERVVLTMALLPGAFDKTLTEGGCLAIPEISPMVRIAIESNGSRISANFSSRETVAILGGRWPDEENVARIRRSIEDRKAYPMPDYEPPPERSRLAQGQTKKPGSHSESRHS